LGKEEPLPFLARRMLFGPGREPIGHRENLLFAEPIENTHYLEKSDFSFQLNLRDPGNTYEPRK
jgi:hypothetical protein